MLPDTIPSYKAFKEGDWKKRLSKSFIRNINIYYGYVSYVCRHAIRDNRP